MIYQLTSCKEIIARLNNNFDIDFTDWITRAPLWIADALHSMEMVSAYEEVSLPLTIENYYVSLPNDAVQDIKRILGVAYNKQLLIRLNVINPYKLPKTNIRTYSSETYNIKNGYITTSIEEGEIILFYERVAVEYDEQRMIYFPLVPNDSVIQQAIEWYLIYCILRKGHKHSTYSLESNNPYTNPALMWEKEKKIAMNKGSKLDPDERANLSKTLTTFLINNNRYISSINDNDLIR